MDSYVREGKPAHLRLLTCEREYRFHPVRMWRFDFAWPDRMVACEVEGGTYIQGGHNRGPHIESDCAKVSEACALGWRVLRVTAAMVKSGAALDVIVRALVYPGRLR